MVKVTLADEIGFTTSVIKQMKKKIISVEKRNPLRTVWMYLVNGKKTAAIKRSTKNGLFVLFVYFVAWSVIVI